MTDPEVGKQQNIFRYRSYRRIVVPTKDIKKYTRFVEKYVTL